MAKLRRGKSDGKQQEQPSDLQASPLSLPSSTKDVSSQLVPSTKCTTDPLRRIGFPELKFSVTHFFLLGSPVGVFMAIQGLGLGCQEEGVSSEMIEKEKSLFLSTEFDTAQNMGLRSSLVSFLIERHIVMPSVEYLWNIFHPYDPVAYRLEPLVSRSLASLPPALVPEHSSGGLRFHKAFEETQANMWKSLKGFGGKMSKLFTGTSWVGEEKQEKKVEEVEEEREKLINEEETLIRLNPMRRLDFAIQEMPQDLPYIAAVNSHTSYWRCPDTVYFVCGQILQSQKKKESK